MKCVKIRKLLRDYLRGQTDSQTTAAAATHLGTCEDCARELAFLKTYYAKISSLETLEAPDSLLVNIRQQLGQTGNRDARGCGAEKSGWPWFWTGKVPQIAGVLTVALIVFLVFNPFQMGKKLRQDAKITQETAPQTLAPKDQSKETMLFDSNEPQSKSVPATVPENRRLAAKRIDPENASAFGEGGQTTGERSLIFTMRQPPAMADMTLAYDSAGGWSEAMETEMDPKSITEKSVLKKEQNSPALNATVVLAVKSLVKSVAGEVLQEDLEEENGQQPSLLIRIPVQNYSVFIEKLQEIGSVNREGSEAPLLSPKTLGTAQSNSQQFVEIRLILDGIF